MQALAHFEARACAIFTFLQFSSTPLKIRNKCKHYCVRATLKKNHTIFVVKYSFTHNVINLQFSSFAQPQSKSLLLFRIEWPEFQPTSNGSASTCLHKILLSEVIVDSVSQSASNAQHATEVGQL
jgi:hypothetical protein